MKIEQAPLLSGYNPRLLFGRSSQPNLIHMNKNPLYSISLFVSPITIHHVFDFFFPILTLNILKGKKREHMAPQLVEQE